MSTKIRNAYKMLAGLGIEKQQLKCKCFLDGLNTKRGDDLADWFADDVSVNEVRIRTDALFLTPAMRKNRRKPEQKKTKRVRVPMTLKTAGVIKLIAGAAPYHFEFVEREIPHLRGETKLTTRRSWIDYIGRTSENTPILGEIKFDKDQNAFLAFIQLLGYLSEMATTNQIQRAIRCELFGSEVAEIEKFDLHILLVNRNSRSAKERFIAPTRELACAFKDNLRHKHPDVATKVGQILCISGYMEDKSDNFSSDLKCLWVV